LIATTRERASSGESYQQTITLGVRIPFGAGPRHDARTAGARAEATEVLARLALARERLDAEREAARARVEASRL
jgi:cobalt-zinc-cadmium efflux system outer membrane protein